MDLFGQWIDRAHQHRKFTRIDLDMESSVSENCGRQQVIGIGPSVVDRGVRSGSQPAERPDLSAYSLDRGVPPESNTSSGDPNEVADGEANPHLGNPGSRIGVVGPLPAPNYQSRPRRYRFSDPIQPLNVAPPGKRSQQECW